MAKYHIGKNGRPEVCRANHKPCPLGGKHFESMAEAGVYADYLLTSQFINVPEKESNDVEVRTLDGFTLKQETYHDKSSTEYHATMFENMMNVMKQAGYGGSKKERRGLQSETFMSFEYARDMKLDNAMAISKHGEIYKLDGNNSLSPQEMKLYSSTEKAITDKIKQYRPDVKPKNLIKSIYYSSDGTKAVVQMGAPNMPDIAIVENGKTRLLEAKDLSSQGSQIDSVTSEVGENGLPTLDTSKMSEPVKQNAKMAGFGKTIGTNYVFNNVTYHDALNHFITNQQEQGVSALTYIGRDEKVHEIDITRNPDEVSDKMTEHGIHATLIMRSNEISNKPSANTVDRWKRTRAKKYFTNKTYPTNDVVPLSDFNLSDKSQLSIMKGHLCVGEMELPIDMKDVKDLRNVDKSTPINMKAIKARQMTFTGHLFQDTKKEREVTYNDRT